MIAKKGFFCFFLFFVNSGKSTVPLSDKYRRLRELVYIRGHQLLF